MANRAGVIGRVELRRNILARTKKFRTDLLASTYDTARTAGVVARNTGHYTIMTTESSLRPGKPNRYWTGAMFHAFDFDVAQTSGKTTVKFGWIADKEKYFLTQEYGGFFAGKTITPMHALANALTASQNYLHDKGIK